MGHSRVTQGSSRNVIVKSRRETNMANQLSAINHIVVLMLENRSFDHMLGLLYFGEWQCLARGSAF